MFLFIQGEIYILTVEQNLDLYYQAFIEKFGEVSRSRWEGSSEYEICYAAAQRDAQNGIVIEQGIQAMLDTITEANASIKRPAVLQSRVAERFLEVSNEFAENGYIATCRVADDTTKGIAAICVDYTPDGGAEDESIAQLIADEMLPAGQHMAGDIVVPIALSNGQSVDVAYKAPAQHDIDFKITITVDRNSQYSVDDVDTIVQRFLANFNEQNPLGMDITPKTYYQIEKDAPYAAEIVTTYDIDGSGTYIGTITESNYDDKYNATLDPVNVIIEY